MTSFYGMREPFPPTVLEARPPMVLQIVDQQVQDLGEYAGVATPPQWDPQQHDDHDPRQNGRALHTSPHASALLFGVTESGQTVTVRVEGVEWHVMFRLHDTSGAPFEADQVDRLTKILRNECQNQSLTFERQWKYQTSGFVAEPDASEAEDRPVRRKLLFGAVTFRSVREFEACKRASNRILEWGKRTHELWRPEELKIGDVVNKVNDRYGFRASGWVEIAAYEIGCFEGRSISHDDLEIRTSPSAIRCLERLTPAPIRYVSVDIETFTPRMDHRGRRKFPKATEPRDRIIQIGMVFGRLGQGEGEGEVKIILCLGETDAPEGVEVRSFGSIQDGITHHDEADMLSEFAKLIVESNVRCIMGYNLNGFDYPYMITRAQTLAEYGTRSFWYMSPLLKVQASSREYTNRRGRALTCLQIPGIFTVDLLEQVQELPGEMKSYKLDDVAETFLGRKKVEMDYNDMMQLYRGNSAARGKIAHYCIVDCELPSMLSERLNVLPTLMSYSNITHNTVGQLLSRGVTAVLSTYLARVAHEYGYIYTTTLLNGTPMAAGADVKYKGGLIFDPDEGAHWEVSCLDFASLYPSIVRTFNLCPSTCLFEGEHAARAAFERHAGTDVQVYPTDLERFAFVANPVDDNGGDGLLPIALRTILEGRAAARKAAKAPGVTPQEAANLEIKQKRLKVLANAMYGLLGGKTDTACVAVAAAVTYMGRTLIERVKDLVESYTDDGKPLFRVVYGDTDSVFVKQLQDKVEWSGKAGMDRLAGLLDVALKEEFCHRGDAAASEAARLHWVVELENEELFKVIWFFKKKQYLALRPDGSKMEKGIAIKRSDMCPFAADLVRSVVYQALDDSVTMRGSEASKAALEMLDARLRGVMNDGISYEGATISNKLTIPPEGTRNEIRQPHALVAYDLGKRTGTKIAAGDRVPFVYSVVTDNPKLSCRSAQCPDHARIQGIPLDTAQYLEVQVMNPLQRFFSHFGPTCVKERMMPYIEAFKACQKRQLDRHFMSKRGKAMVATGSASLRREEFEPDVKWDPNITALRPTMPPAFEAPRTGNSTKRPRTLADMFAPKNAKRAR